MAKSVGFGIMNMATDKAGNKEACVVEAAWALAKVANAIQSAQDKNTEKMMQMFQAILATMVNQLSTSSNGNDGRTGQGSCSKALQVGACSTRV